MKLNCPSCQALLNLNDSLAKKLVKCPKCEQKFVVPDVPPAPKPFNGQFIQVDVVDVK